MTSDPSTEEIFIENLRSAERIGGRLFQSTQKLSLVMPISAAEIDRLDDNTQESVDAFIKRFEQLQDIIENRLFRGIALLEQEDVYGKSKRDLTLLMEKFGIIESADKWSLLSMLRNKLAHEYPGDSVKQVERINEAYNSAQTLIEVLSRLKQYVIAKKLVHFSESNHEQPITKNQ